MFFRIRLRPTSVAGKKGGSIQYSHAVVYSIAIFSAFAGLYFIAVHDTAPDKNGEARAKVRHQVEYQFEKNATKFTGFLPPKTDVPTGLPTVFTGKVAVVDQIGYLNKLHWDLPDEWAAGNADEVNNLIIVSYNKETPGIAARIYFFDFNKKTFLGKVEIKSTPDMAGSSGHTFVNGALSDALVAWMGKANMDAAAH
jgi:hypothetical protein